MASVFTRPGSRFYWIKYRDPATGERKRESTKIPIAHGSQGRRDAKLAANLKTRAEMSAPIVREKERWEAWAGLYLEQRYAGEKHAKSLKNAKFALDDLLTYFSEKSVTVPRQVKHDVAAGFAEWRALPPDLNYMPPIGANTIKLRCVYLSVIMGEAVRRGFCDFNPMRDVVVKGVPPKGKLEITAEHQTQIEEALKTAPEWMRDQWDILMLQGCRIAETNVPLERVDEKARIITFKLKGGKLHPATLHPGLLPLVKRAKDAQRETLLDAPRVTSWSSIWSKFFERRKLPYSAHCTRVTVITRLARAGWTVPQICNLIGHTEEVNKIYRKLMPDDSSALLSTLAVGAR